MKIVPTSFVFLEKKVDSLSVACSFGDHRGCSQAKKNIKSLDPEVLDYISECDCKCHEIASCALCDTPEMELAELAVHMFAYHGNLASQDWGDEGMVLLAIGVEVPPNEVDIQLSLAANRINHIYLRQILDWFNFVHGDDEDLTKIACKMCSWQYFGCRGRQPLRDEILESHLISCHAWKREVPQHETNLSVMPYYMANPYDILIHREPIDPPPDFDLAAAVVKMYQSSGDEEWGVFRSYDLAPFLPKGAKLFEALKSLTDKGWILYLRGADYRAEPSLIIACLRAGLGKNRQLNR